MKRILRTAGVAAGAIVLVGVVWEARQLIDSQPAGDQQTSHQGTEATPPAPVPEVAAVVEPAEPPVLASQPAEHTHSPEFAVYYFHRTQRCPTCLQFEEWAGQVANGAVAAQVSVEAIGWRSINLDEPADQHFEKDFELDTQSLVLIRRRDGQVLKWKNLQSIWDWAGDQAGFTKYVQEELSSFLAEQSESTH